MKTSLAISWPVAIPGAIYILFRHNESEYVMPAFVPANCQPVKKSTQLNISYCIKRESNKPAFFPAFYCDKLRPNFHNVYFKSFTGQHKERINVSIGVQSKKKQHNIQYIPAKSGLQLPVFFNGLIIVGCGIYPPQQPALIDEKNKLYFKQNCNKAVTASKKNNCIV